ncbi:MAG: hypothetical protein II135_06055 [Clostridia bacterium]|nr:hypothetical protein [Clostridia bacterium]MBQ3869591.1 hypothetical protein [Clostridia bacterium]
MKDAKDLKNAWKKILLILLLFAVFEAIYQGALYLEKRYFPYTPVCIVVLFVLVGALLILFMILNRGFDRTKYTENSFDASLPYEKRKELAEKYNKNRERAKTVIIFFIPLAAVLAIDILDLNFDIFDKIGALFS